MTEKDRFINKVSKSSQTRYSEKLVEMLEYYEVYSLEELTLQEIKEYLIHVNK